MPKLVRLTKAQHEAIAEAAPKSTGKVVSSLLTTRITGRQTSTDTPSIHNTAERLVVTQTDFVKCAACGWLHFAISRAAALDEMEGVNEMLERDGSSQKATFDAYLRCHRCGADSASFLVAQESDAPPGVTIQAVVVER